MKVVYYEKKAKSPIHIHAGSHAFCFYIPHEDIVLYKERLGTFGGEDYSFTDRPEILKQARAITEGKIPDVKGVGFSEIKEFEYDSSKLQELIQNTRLKAELETKVKAGIEDLLKQVK